MCPAFRDDGLRLVLRKAELESISLDSVANAGVERFRRTGHSFIATLYPQMPKRWDDR